MWGVCLGVIPRRTRGDWREGVGGVKGRVTSLAAGREAAEVWFAWCGPSERPSNYLLCFCLSLAFPFVKIEIVLTPSAVKIGVSGVAYLCSSGTVLGGDSSFLVLSTGTLLSFLCS